MYFYLDGYSNNDVLYAWAKSGKDPVGKEEGVNLAQYDLKEIKTSELIRLSSRRGKPQVTILQHTQPKNIKS